MLKNNFFCRSPFLGLFLVISLFPAFHMRAAEVKSILENHILSEPSDNNVGNLINKIKKISMRDEPNLVSWKLLYEGREKACEEIKKILDNVSDEDVLKLVGYYGASFDLLVNVLATTAFTHYYTGISDVFSSTIHGAWDKITNFDASVDMPVMLVVKELDNYIKKSETIGGQKAGFSLIDVGVLVQDAIQRGEIFKNFFRLLFTLEKTLFGQMHIPTKDADLAFCGMTSFELVWERIIRIMTAHDQVFSSDGCFFSVLEVIKQNSNFLSPEQANRILRLASRPNRFKKRLEEIEVFLNNSLSGENKEAVEKAKKCIEDLEQCLSEFNQSTTLGAKLDPIFLSLMSHFFNTGHITILHLSAIFDVLEKRISGMTENSEKSQLPAALLDVKKYQKKLCLLLKLLSKKSTEDKVGGKKKKYVEESGLVGEKVEGFEELVKDLAFWDFPYQSAEKKAKMLGFEFSTLQFWISFKYSLAPFIRWIRKMQLQNETRLLESSNNKNSNKKRQKQVGDGLKQVVRIKCETGCSPKWYGNKKVIYTLPSWYPSLTGIQLMMLILFPQKNLSLGSLGGDNYYDIVKQMSTNITPATQKKCTIDNHAAMGREVLRFAAERDEKSGKKTYRLVRVVDLPDDLRKALNLSEKMSDGMVLLCPGFVVGHREMRYNIASALWKLLNCREYVANLSQILACIALFNNVPPNAIQTGLFFACLGRDENSQKIEKESEKLRLEDVGFCEYRAFFGYLSKDDYPKEVLNGGILTSLYNNTELSAKYKKDLDNFSASELGAVYNYLANRFRFHLMFVSYEKFVKASQANKTYENFKYPYFGVLDTIATSLLKEHENMSEAVRIFIDAFDADEAELMGYSVMDLLKLHKLRCENKRAFSNMIGLKKKIEDLFYPAGHEHQRTLDICEKERDLRRDMFKILFGKKTNKDDFFIKEGEYLSKESPNFKPMKDLYTQVFLRLQKFPFLCNDRMFFAILGGLFDRETKIFFLRNSKFWLYSNRLFDMDMKKLPFISNETLDLVKGEWAELRTLMHALQFSLDKAKAFETDVFVNNFCGHLPPLINLYSTLIDLTSKHIKGGLINNMLSPYGLVVRCLFSYCQNRDAELFFEEIAQLLWSGDDFGRGIIPSEVEKKLEKPGKRYLLRKELLTPFLTDLKNRPEYNDKKVSFRSIIAEITSPLPVPLPVIEKK